MKRREFIKGNLVVGTSALTGLNFGYDFITKPAEADLRKADVVIFGATPSGITSAIRIARSGFSVALVNVFKHIGGMFVNGLSIMDTLYEGFRAPLYEEFLSKLRTYYLETYGVNSDQYMNTLFGERNISSNRPKFESHVAQKIINEWVKNESNIIVYTGYEVFEVKKKGRQIDKIKFKYMDENSYLELKGKIYIDASYEGDLMAMSGVKYVVGREDRKEYNEQFAGKIFGTRGTGSFPYEAESGMINLRTFHVVSQQIFSGSTGKGDQAVQAYNPRFTLTNNPHNKIEIEMPKGYNRLKYIGILEDRKTNHLNEYPVKADLLIGDIEKVEMGFRMMNNKYGNNLGNYPGHNWYYPEANWSKRKQIIDDHIDHALGLLYFLQNDSEVPESVRKRTKQYGLAKDEFVDNNYVPYEIYVREARRMRGRYIFNENDASLCEGIERTPIHCDSIAIAEWPMDSHDCSSQRKPGSLHDGIILLTEKTRPSQIPYRSLLPVELDNLMVTVCLSSTHVGWGTIRVEPTLMHIAESAGIAAILSLKQNVYPSNIDFNGLQKELIKNQIMVSFFNDLDMGDREEWVPAVQYFGTKGFFRGYNALPMDNLSLSTAEVWVNILNKLLDKVPYDESREAAKLPKEEKATSTNSLSTAEFVGLLQNQTNLKELIINSTVKSLPGLNPSDAEISRGNACLLMYNLLQNGK